MGTDNGKYNGKWMENEWKMNLDFNGRANGFYNGNEWVVNLEMKTSKLIWKNDLIITND